MRYEERLNLPPRDILDHQLDLARERVEEEIAASLFVWGAWRELFDREPGPPGFERASVEATA